MAKLVVSNDRGYIVDVLEDAAPTPAAHYAIVVTDRTVAQTQEYLEDWRNQPAITQLQFNPETNRRRLLVEGGMVSVSGRNAFTRINFIVIQGNLESIGLSYSPDAIYVSHTPDSFTFDVTVAPGDVSAAQAVVEHEYREMVTDFKRWRVTPESLVWLENNGGEFVGTASEVGPRLQDGLLT